MHRLGRPQSTQRPVSSISRLCVVFLFIVYLVVSPRSSAAQADPVFDLLNRIDTLRRQNELVPLALSDQLSAAAQRHSQDMANTASVSHTGSDGSTPEQRIAQAAYARWESFGVWGENIYGGGIASVEDAWTFWINSQLHLDNLLSGRYREIGIGVATSASGTYYTLNFGARPGVLPFFIDQGSVLTSVDVTLTLSNEEAVPNGPGGAFARAVEVRVGEGEDLSAVAWQPWQRSIPLTLSNVAGQHRISVEYRDASGSTATYFKLVTLNTDQPVPSATPEIIPTVAPTHTHTVIPTIQPSDTPVPSSATPTATATATQIPSDTPESTRSPTSTPQPETSTIESSPAPATETLVPVNSADMTTATATIESIDQPLIESLISRGWSDAPTGLLGLMGALQIVAVMLGATAVVIAWGRRSK